MDKTIEAWVNGGKGP